MTDHPLPEDNPMWNVRCDKGPRLYVSEDDYDPRGRDYKTSKGACNRLIEMANAHPDVDWILTEKDGRELLRIKATD